MMIYKIPEISYRDVIDFNKYIELCIQFNEYDSDEHYKDKNKLREEISFQTYEITLSKPSYDKINEVPTQDLEVTKGKIKNLHIYDDFLFPALKKYRDREIGAIEIRRRNEKKYSQHEKLGFYNELSSEYSLIFDEIDNCNFHDDKLKDKLREIILEIKDYCNEQIDALSNFEKIPLTFTNEDIAAIFGRLHSHGYISGIGIPKLSSLLSLYFTQKGGKRISPTIRNKINKYSKNLPTSEEKQSYFIDLFRDLFSK